MNRLAGLVVAWALLPSVLTGQEVSVSASRWLTDPRVMDYRLAIGGRPIGPIRLTPFTHFNFQGPPHEFVAAFRDYYGPTMNAFDAAEKGGRMADLQSQLVDLFRAQNKSSRKEMTSIPATFLRVTVSL